jgi:hypothetical protein
MADEAICDDDTGRVVQTYRTMLSELGEAFHILKLAYDEAKELFEEPTDEDR